MRRSLHALSLGRDDSCFLCKFFESVLLGCVLYEFLRKQPKRRAMPMAPYGTIKWQYAIVTLKNVGAIINRPAVKPYEFAGSRAKRQHFTAGRIISAPTLFLLKIRLSTH